MSCPVSITFDMQPAAALELAELLQERAQELRGRITDRAERRGLGVRCHRSPDWDDRYSLTQLQNAARGLLGPVEAAAAAAQELHQAGAPGDYRGAASLSRRALALLQAVATAPSQEAMPLRTYRAAAARAWERAELAQRQAETLHPGTAQHWRAWSDVATRWQDAGAMARRCDDTTAADAAHDHYRYALARSREELAAVAEELNA